MIPSAAIACLLWLKAEHPTKVRAWWKILSRSWIVLCVTQILIIDGRQIYLYRLPERHDLPMRTEQAAPLRLIPLWGPNYQQGTRLGKSRGSRAGVRAIAKYRRWKKLADRMRLFPERL